MLYFFVFNTALNAVTNVDAITDFSAKDDTIAMENAVFRRLKAGVLDTAFFKLGKAAGDSNDFVIYDRSTGLLSYDADAKGNGAAVVFAKLKAGTALTHLDILVV